MERFAVYYAPPEGAFSRRADAWLGRDAATGRPVAHSDLGLPAAAMTRAPRRYGFHGTIRPPFRLAPGQDAAAMQGALGDLAARLAPVTLPGLRLASLGGFLALVPDGDTAALSDLAAAVVRGLDAWRAPLTGAKIARRRPGRLSPRQRELLAQWGYPVVMEEFRFHLTLTDPLEAPLARRAARILADHFAPVLPQPFSINDLCLFGEDAEGQFRLLRRYALAG